MTNPANTQALIGQELIESAFASTRVDHAAARSAHRKALQALDWGSPSDALLYARSALDWHGGLMDANEHVNRYRLTLVEAAMAARSVPEAVIAGEQLIFELELGTLAGPSFRARSYAWLGLALAHLERGPDATVRAHQALEIMVDDPRVGAEARLEVLGLVLWALGGVGAHDRATTVAWAAEQFAADHMVEFPGRAMQVAAAVVDVYLGAGVVLAARRVAASTLGAARDLGVDCPLLDEMRAMFEQLEP